MMNNISSYDLNQSPSEYARNSETNASASEPPPCSTAKQRRRPRRASHDPATRALLYRYGFVAFARDAPPPDAESLLIRLGWTKSAVGPVLLWNHPEAKVRVVTAGEASFVFIGDVIPETAPEVGDPFAPERLATVAAGGEAALLDFVDGFAGRFALLFVEATRTRVLHDAMGARSVFYHAKPPFAVASHAELLARCVDAEPDPAVHALFNEKGLGSWKTKALPGDLTLARDVFALVPNNLYDSAASGTRRYWPRTRRRARTVAAFHERLDATVSAIGRHAAGGDVLVLGATAGADSRLLMAGLTRYGHAFETVTWRMDELSPRDRGIIADLVTRLGAPHVEAPLADGVRGLAVSRHNSGGFRDHGSVLDARAVYGARPETLFVRGHGAEVIRGFYNIHSTRMVKATPSEMARLYFSRKRETPPDALIEMFEGFFRRANYAGLSRWGYDPNDIFYWEYRMGMWSTCLANELDVAMRSVPGFNSRPLFEAGLGLPPETRLTKWLFLDAAARFDRRLGGLEIDKMAQAREARRVARPESPAQPWASSEPDRDPPGLARLGRFLRRLGRRAWATFPSSRP